jgi:hypothetical protein
MHSAVVLGISSHDGMGFPPARERQYSKKIDRKNSLHRLKTRPETFRSNWRSKALFFRTRL